MARLKRLVMAGVAHHVSQCAVAESAAFLDAVDHQAYVAALRRCSQEHQVAVLAYALVQRQVQLVLVPAEAASLGRMMQALTRQYVGPHNRRHARTGALWQSRFCSAPVQSSTDLLDCVLHVEQAPVRAGMGASALEHPWSSARHHAGLGGDVWLSAMPADSAYWRLGNTPFEREAAYRLRLEQALDAVTTRRIETTVLKGWALGSPGFVAEIGASAGRRASPALRGRPRLGRA